MNHSHETDGLSYPESILVVIPTYNEVDTLEAVITRLRRAVPCAYVLVVDDNSPDGTGQLADRLSASNDHIDVLHRPGKQGLGAAYLAGFKWGIGRGFDVLVQMDADGSHQPEELPRLLAALDRSDLVLGSRWVPGGRVCNWPVARRVLSRGGSAYARLALGIPVKDITGGYHALRSRILSTLDLDTVASSGYCFQIELTWRAIRSGVSVVEVPITFTEREQGRSKMSVRIVREALWRVTRWGLDRHIGVFKRRRQQPAVTPHRPALSDGSWESTRSAA